MRLPKFAVPKFLNREVTIRLTDEGFVSQTRRARFFAMSDNWHVDLAAIRVEEPAASGSLIEMPRAASLIPGPNQERK